MPRTMVLLWLSALASALVLSACGDEPRDSRPGQPVAHRRLAFKELVKASEPLGVMLRADQYEPKKFKALIEQLMLRRDAPWDYFGADTLYPPSHARAEVWTDAARFAARKSAFLAATDRLAAIAGTEDGKLAATAFAAVEQSCKDCHDSFRKR